MADATTIDRPRKTHRQRVLNVWGVLKQTFVDWRTDNAMRLSAALSLYSLLSLAPLLVITFKLVGAVLRNKDYARDQIIDQVTNLMGWQAAEVMRPMIETGAQAGGGKVATIVSLAVLAFSSTGVFVELQDSMNTIWGVKPKPSAGVWEFVRNRLLSLGMVLGIAFLLLISMFVSTVLGAVAKYLAGDAKWLAIVLDVAVSFGAVSVMFAAIFKFLPDVHLRWRHVWLGAVMTAACFTVGKYALATYFRFAAPTSAFGAAGSLAAVMLWVYYSSFILFFGAEFTKVWSVRHLRHKVIPVETAVKVTEEDRAQRGIPSEGRLEAALEGRLSNGESPRPVVLRPVVRVRRGGGAAVWVLAAGGVMLGTIVGAKAARGNGRCARAR